MTLARGTARLPKRAPNRSASSRGPRSAAGPRQRRLTLRVVVKVKDAAGNATTATRKAPLKLKR